jgi:hypothetical protein
VFRFTTCGGRAESESKRPSLIQDSTRKTDEIARLATQARLASGQDWSASLAISSSLIQL